MIASYQRGSRFRSALLMVCKSWNAAMLQQTFTDLEPYLLKVDQQKLVSILRLAWTSDLVALRTALCAAVGPVWKRLTCRPPETGELTRNWLADQIFQHDWVEIKQKGCNCYASSWKPDRLLFTRGHVSYEHPLGNWYCDRIENETWRRGYWDLRVDGEAVDELNMCQNGCGSDSISLHLETNLAGEPKLVLTTHSSCMCSYENIGYGNPPEEFVEGASFRLLDVEDKYDDDDDDEEDDDDEDDDEEDDEED
jgi:hypothetical protein